jgi:DNA helicase-2/ATP-dependent DNA helicase PcrA
MSAVLQQAVKKRVWSEHQLNCFGEAAVGTENLIIIAVAGSGKTTTGIEMVKRGRGSHIYVAFNKDIADELSSRGVNGRTYHSVCWSVVMQAFKAQVDGDKLKKLCLEYLSENDLYLYGSFIQRLVGLARNAGVGCLVQDTEEAFINLCAQHDLEPESEDADFGRGIDLARKLLDASTAQTNVIDYDDMLYFPIKYNLALPKFDRVYVDEAQDTNAIQRAITRKMLKDTSRLFAVGDPAQAIYGFRGADSDSMDLLKAEFKMKEMPLTVTYRCAKSIVEFARQWVNHIEAAPDAPEGAVHKLGRKWDHKVFQANDLVVCRVTAPLITLAYKLLTNHVPVTVLGREIGQGLKSLINKMKAKGIPQLETKLAAWVEREVKKAMDADNESKAQAVKDKADCVSCLIAGLDENHRTIPELLRTIDNLFANKENAVRLATIHKSKGLEAERVFWLNSSKCPSKWARQEWQKQQEINLCYVAATRAKTDLFLIEDSDGGTSSASNDVTLAKFEASVKDKFEKYEAEVIDTLERDMEIGAEA